MQMGYSPRMRCIPRVFTAQSSSNRHEQAKRLPARDFCFKFMSPPYLQCNFDSVTSSVCRTSFSSRILKPVCTDHCSGAKEKNCLSTLCINTRWKKVRKVITRRGLMRERERTQMTGIVDKVAGFYKNVILKILCLCVQNPNKKA